MPAGFERDPVAPYAILFKTHFWDDFVQRRFDFLKSRARGGDVWVIVDETHGRVSGINHDRVVRTCEANLKSIGLGGYPESKLNWYNNDYQLIYFYRQYPKYIFYITIEYDAVFNGDFDVFANTAIERETDLVAHPISTPADQWCWRPTCEEVWPANRILHQLLCISGFSNRAVAQIDAVRVAHSKLYASGQLTKWPFCEGFVPTALHEAGFKLEPLANYGGTGFYEWWPPYHESQLGDVPATNFIHPVLTGRRYIDLYSTKPETAGSISITTPTFAAASNTRLPKT